MARNSMSVKLEVSPDGVQALLDAVRSLTEQQQMDVLGDALKDACQPIVRDARARVKKRTGALKRSIGVVVRKYRKDGNLVAVIGPQNMNVVAERKKSGRLGFRKFAQGDDAKKRINPAKYAHLVEFGHRSVHGGGALPNFGEKVNGVWNSVNNGKSIRKGTLSATSFVAPRPFLRPAFDAHKDAVLEAMAFAMQKAVDRVKKRLENRVARKVKRWQVAA